jgi:antagonist of KipI
LTSARLLGVNGQPVFEVLEPGLLTTIQDGGRPDAMALGVTRSGACDPLAFAAANLLCGNVRDAPALEINLLGPELGVLQPCVIALSGADCEVRLEPSGRAFEPGTAIQAESEARIVFGPAQAGVRAYLAVRGGFDVPRVLGSASTALQGGFGGIEGRPLRTGDVLHAGFSGPRPVETPRTWPGPGASSGVVERDPVELRLLPGPHGGIGGGSDWRRLTESTWEVDPRSDRVGVRLRPTNGAAAQVLMDAPMGGSGILSMPMVWGAVEMPVGGSPICLLADHPTIGGYPVVGVVAWVDLPVLGQLAPSTVVVFTPVTLEEATAAAQRAAAELAEAEARLQAGARTRSTDTVHG